MARRLHPADRQRLIRAWEILEATGRSLADWQAEDRRSEAVPRRRLRLCLTPPRATLYAACDGRFLAMMARGALDEVARLLDLRLDPALPIMKALGVPELAAHIAGEIPLDTAIARSQQAIRRYAKRQLTWLRTQGGRQGAPQGEPQDETQGEPQDAPQGARRGSGGNGDPGRSEVGKKPAQETISAQFSESIKPKIFKIIRNFLLTAQF